MIPPEMFLKVIDAKTNNDKWIHVPVLDAIEHVDANQYTVWINGHEHQILVDDANKTFPFLRDE
jgi:hypothetical protein